MQVRKRTGFTLIELLVVIAIIAILAAILFPVLAEAQRTARRASCQSNLKEMATACLMYTDDYNGRTPGSHWFACVWGDGKGWSERLAKYLGNKGKHPPTKGEHKVYQCPSAGRIDYSYGITDYCMPTNDHSAGLVISKLNYPTRQMLFYDLPPQGAIIGESGQSNDLQTDGCSYWNSESHPNMINGVQGHLYSYDVYWPGWHKGNNFAIADGHVIYLADWNSARLTYTDSPPRR